MRLHIARYMVVFTSLLVSPMVPTLAQQGSGEQVGKAADRVELSQFSFSHPDEKRWDTAVLTKRKAEFKAKKRKAYYQMAFMENFVLDQAKQNWSAKAIADDFRDYEKKQMELLGVMAGIYELRDLVKGEETVGGKRFYTMTYSTKMKSKRLYTHSSLYLYFPSDQGGDVFLVALYSESAKKKRHIKESLKADFLKVLEGVTAEEGQAYLYERAKNLRKLGDLDEAIELFRQAAIKGDRRASRTLGEMYRLGQGVDKDVEEAMKWYQLAAEQGDTYSKGKLRKLQSDLGS